MIKSASNHIFPYHAAGVIFASEGGGSEEDDVAGDCEFDGADGG
jgi:hypothetical protein